MLLTLPKVGTKRAYRLFDGASHLVDWNTAAPMITLKVQKAGLDKVLVRGPLLTLKCIFGSGSP